MMYTVYDFINNEIPTKRMKFGWKIEMSSNFSHKIIILRHIMLNFDWNSLKFLNDEIFNMFLSSKSYANMKSRIDRYKLKFKRTYFEAYSIEYLKTLIDEYDLKIDLDKLISKTIKRRSEKVKNK